MQQKGRRTSKTYTSNIEVEAQAAEDVEKSERINNRMKKWKTIQVIKNKWIIWTRANKEQSSSETSLLLSLCVVSFVQIIFLLKQNEWKKREKNPTKE